MFQAFVTIMRSLNDVKQRVCPTEIEEMLVFVDSIAQKHNLVNFVVLSPVVRPLRLNRNHGQ